MARERLRKVWETGNEKSGKNESSKTRKMRSLKNESSENPKNEKLETRCRKWRKRSSQGTKKLRPKKCPPLGKGKIGILARAFQVRKMAKIGKIVKLPL